MVASIIRPLGHLLGVRVKLARAGREVQTPRRRGNRVVVMSGRREEGDMLFLELALLLVKFLLL